MIIQGSAKIKGPAEICLANPFIKAFQFVIEVDIEAELILIVLVQLIHGHADVVLGLSYEGVQRDAGQLTGLTLMISGIFPEGG